LRTGNDLKQERSCGTVIQPTKRSYGTETCRPRGCTNWKPADQEVVRIESSNDLEVGQNGKPADLDLDLEQKRSGESEIQTTWRLCESEILTTWRSCESEISLDLEVVRITKGQQRGRTDQHRPRKRSGVMEVQLDLKRSGETEIRLDLKRSGEP